MPEGAATHGGRADHVRWCRHAKRTASDQGSQMNRTAALLTIALLSSLATPLVVQATTPTPREPIAAPAAVQTAAVETMPAVAEPACARKVKVVYRGYGEGAASPCAVEAAK